MAWFSDQHADRHFFVLAVVVYGVSMVYSVFLWRKGFRKDNRVNYFLLLAAFGLHTLSMVKRGFSLNRCPVNNLYEATMFIAWTIVAAYLPGGRLVPAAVSRRVRFAGFVRHGRLRADARPRLPHGQPGIATDVWTSLHAALILLSFGAFGLGSVAALMYLTQEHNLKFHKLRAMFSAAAAHPAPGIARRPAAQRLRAAHAGPGGGAFDLSPPDQRNAF